MMTRRAVMQLISAIGGTAGFQLMGVSAAAAGSDEWLHGLSLFGKPKYPAGFKHFDYVNPQAPRGGRVRMYGIGTFDSLNPFTFKGAAGGLVNRTFETLMAPSNDEPSSEYGQIAEAVKHPANFSQVSYRLRPQARFHDGNPITVQDVIWSMQALKKAHPQYAFYYQNITRAEQTGEREVTFFFSETGNRELPHITGQLPVLPQSWWTGTKPDGRQRSIEETTLEAPLGSGPYKVSDVKPARSITVARVADYWGMDLPTQRGKHNFDEITITYFRDQTVAFEAFKGDQFDWRNENSSKNWATGYDFPAVKRGDVVVEEITLKNARPMQGFAFNSRRSKFADPRVRRAFNFAFDFEWSNTNLFHSQYRRTASYFANSELAATGLPQADELAILNSLKGRIPEEVFTTEFTNPVSATPQDKRNNLRSAAKLLRAAGWKVGKDRILADSTGEVLEAEFLLYSPLFERIVLPYIEQLQRLGIKAKIRTVDSAQYERRVQNFDFDIVVGGWGQSLSPGNEQREYWSSAAADRPGSQNLVGIKDAAIDEVIDKIIYARDRTELVAATRALDRILLWNHFVVPTWHIPYERTARWNRFGRPDVLPAYSTGFPDIWWWDEEKANKVKAG